MRTTITLSEDLYRLVNKYMKDNNLQPKETYNHLIRMGLAVNTAKIEKKPFKFNPPIFTQGGEMMPGFSSDMSFSEIQEKIDEEEFKS